MRLRNDSQSFHPVYPLIRAFGPRHLHHAKGRGIRSIRIRVRDVLELYAAGLSSEQILADYPDLEPEDLSAALDYAAREIDHPVLVG